MNLVLTSACNKNCSFCFAKPFVKDPSKEILGLDKAKNIARQVLAGGERLSLLGGEPTLYPDFIEYLEYITEIAKEFENPEVLLISNFLFDDDNIGRAIQKATKELDLGFLLNVAEMSQNQMKQFKHNCQFIQDSKISPGITLNKKLPSKYYTDILGYIQTFVPIANIRTSVPNPIKGSRDFEDYYADLPIYRKQLREIIDFCIDHRMPVGFDCGTTRCLFEEPLSLEFVQQHCNQNPEEGHGCKGCAIDLKPDGYMIPCYPAAHISEHIDKYNGNVLALIKKVQTKKNFEVATSEAPKRCGTCEYYQKECSGPCLGFYK